MLKPRSFSPLLRRGISIPVPSRSRRYSGGGMDGTLNVLGIETSCDDTCVSVLRVTPPVSPSSQPRAEILHNAKVTSDHLGWGGIHPVVAVRSHRANLPRLVRDALDSCRLPKPDLVAATRGPGQQNALDVGLHFAKGLAFAWGCPLVGVNHMQAHALTARLAGAGGEGGFPEYPFVSLLVSGGHTLLVLSRSLTEHGVLADTLDTAAGDAVDKIARVLLPDSALASAANTNYGLLLERFVFPFTGEAIPDGQTPEEESKRYEYRPGDVSRETAFTKKYGWTLPKPLEGVSAEHKTLMKFSFAGLRAHLDRNFGIELSKPSAINVVTDPFRRELGWLSQKRLFEHLAGRVLLGLQTILDSEGMAIRDVVIGGGVASNNFLRVILRDYLAANWSGDVRLHYPPAELCTDNAAMVAWCGYEMFSGGWESELEAAPLKKWSLDPGAAREGKDYPDRDNVAYGLMEAGGWKRRPGMDVGAGTEPNKEGDCEGEKVPGTEASKRTVTRKAWKGKVAVVWE